MNEHKVIQTLASGKAFSTRKFENLLNSTDLKTLSYEPVEKRQMTFLKSRHSGAGKKVQDVLDTFLPGTVIVDSFFVRGTIEDLVDLHMIENVWSPVNVPVEFVEGDISQCHENVEELFSTGQIDTICSGYALSDDGCFRHHSWGLRENTLIETTIPRILYVGYKKSQDA